VTMSTEVTSVQCISVTSTIVVSIEYFRDDQYESYLCPVSISVKMSAIVVCPVSIFPTILL
jgi:hypothetical protein